MPLSRNGTFKSLTSSHTRVYKGKVRCEVQRNIMVLKNQARQSAAPYMALSAMQAMHFIDTVGHARKTSGNKVAMNQVQGHFTSVNYYVSNTKYLRFIVNLVAFTALMTYTPKCKKAT